MLADPLYLDSSAIVKLVVDETESDELTRMIESTDAVLTTSFISEIECVRAVNRISADLRDVAMERLHGFVVLPLTDSIRSRTMSIMPGALRSLDAIQLSTAIEIQDSLEGFVSYDFKLNEAARSFGLSVLAPGGRI